MSTENLNFKVFDTSAALRGISDRDRKLRESNPTSILYLEDVYRLIEIKTNNIEVQNKLKEEAKKVPYKALEHFASRLDHLIGVRMREINLQRSVENNTSVIEKPLSNQLTQEDLVSMQENLYNSLEDNGENNVEKTVAEDAGEEAQESNS